MRPRVLVLASSGFHSLKKWTIYNHSYESVTDGHTDGRTARKTDGRTDPSILPYEEPCIEMYFGLFMAFFITHWLNEAHKANDASSCLME